MCFLKSIANYEISNAAVVEVLREIRDEAKRLRDSEMQTETEEVHRANRKSLGTETTEQEVGVSITSQGVQTNAGRVSGYSGIENGTSRSTGVDAELQNGLKSKGVAVGDDGFKDSDRLRDVATETDLEQLHKQVVKFTNSIADF